MRSGFGRWLQATAPTLFAFAKGPAKAAAPILGGLASFVAMFNSFVFNRLWTFEAKGKARRTEQAIRFYAVAVTGALMNAVLFSTIFNSLPPNTGHGILVAKIVAAAIVAVWNFVGQRTFAFRAVKA